MQRFYGLQTYEHSTFAGCLRLAQVVPVCCGVKYRVTLPFWFLKRSAGREVILFPETDRELKLGEFAKRPEGRVVSSESMKMRLTRLGFLAKSVGDTDAILDPRIWCG